jgi:hypothetical protein
LLTTRVAPRDCHEYSSEEVDKAGSKLDPSALEDAARAAALLGYAFALFLLLSGRYIEWILMVFPRWCY